MNKAKQLHELQDVDLQIDSKRQKLADVSAHIGESEALKQARETLEKEEERLAVMSRRQREQTSCKADVNARSCFAKALCSQRCVLGYVNKRFFLTVVGICGLPTSFPPSKKIRYFVDRKRIGAYRLMEDRSYDVMGLSFTV